MIQDYNKTTPEKSFQHFTTKLGRTEAVFDGAEENPSSLTE